MGKGCMSKADDRSSEKEYLQVVGDIFRQSGLFQHYKSNPVRFMASHNAFVLVIDRWLSQA